MGFISGIQRFYNIHKSISVIHHINKLKKKNQCQLSRCRKSSKKEKKKNPTPIKKVGREGTYHNIRKGIYDKPTAHVILDGEKLKAGRK